MKISGIVFHKVISEQHKSEVAIVERGSTIALPNLHANRLMDSVQESYLRPSRLAYAGLLDQHWFSETLLRVVDGKLSLLEFSVQGLRRLKTILESVPSAAGGYLTFVDFDFSGSRYVMVILLKDRSGIAIDQDLQLQDVQSLARFISA